MRSTQEVRKRFRELEDPAPPGKFPRRANLSQSQIEDKGTQREKEKNWDLGGPDFVFQEPPNPFLEEAKRGLPIKSSKQEEIRQLQEASNKTVELYHHLESLKQVLLRQAESDPEKKKLLMSHLALAAPGLLRELFPEKEQEKEKKPPVRRKLSEGKKKTINALEEKYKFSILIYPEMRIEGFTFSGWRSKLEEDWANLKDAEVEKEIRRFQNSLERRLEENSERAGTEQTEKRREKK